MSTFEPQGQTIPQEATLANGAPGLLPGASIDDCLIAQLANELFKGVPSGLPGSPSTAGASAPVPEAEYGAPTGTVVPSGLDTPLSSAFTLAPEIPGAGAGPGEPHTSSLPSTGESTPAAGHAYEPEQPGAGGLSFGAIPDLGYGRATSSPSQAATPEAPVSDASAKPSGDVPGVGDGSFLKSVPHEVDLGLLQPERSVKENSTDAGAPETDKASLLSLALGSLNLGGGAPLVESGSQFYFLPDPVPRKEEKKSSRAYDAVSARGDFPALHQKVNGKPLIWLDNAATTHKPQSVIDAIANFYARDNSNIHRGAHTLAARATDAFEGAREKIANYLGAASKSEIVFTKGATEAINLVAQAWGRKYVNPGDEVIVSELEHHANIVPWQFLVKERGATLKVIPIDDDGQVILEAYEKLLTPRTKIVAVAQVSNVLGTVLPVAQIVQLAHKQGVRVLIDGAQGAPHLPTNVRALDADFYVVAGHKLFGPSGIGVLYGKKDVLDEMPPWQGGGAMIETVSFDKTTFNPPPAKFEAGTPPIAGAVGLGAAVDYVNRFGIESIAAYEEGLMSYATAALSTIPKLRQVGTTPDKVGALAFVIPGVNTEEIGKFLDREGIAVRAGHHCAQPALRRFGLTAAVRPSITLYNTAEDIDALVAALRKLKR